MRTLTGLLLGALLLAPLPASAAGLVLSVPQVPRVVDQRAADKNGCALELSLPSYKSIARSVQDETAFDSQNADNRWATGANSQWNASVNKVADRLFMPPDQVRLHVTQTGEDLRGHYESATNPNATFAALELVIH